MEARDVNIYFVPNDKNKIGGRFYNVYLNREERLDLAPFLNSVVDLDELETKVKEEDDTFKVAGGIILKKDESIGSATIYTPDNGGINLNSEQQVAYQKWIELDKISNDLYDERKKDMEEFISLQRQLDEKLLKIQMEKQELSNQIKESFERGKTK